MSVASAPQSNVTSLSSTITLLSPLTPPSLARAWLSAPHPSLPIVATCSSDKSVRVYSLASFTLLSTITGGHKRSVRSCAWKPGLQHESTLATGSFDASVGVWRHDDDVVDKEGREVDFTSAEGNGDNFDEDDDEEWRFALVLDGHDSEVKSVSWSAGGNFLATCSRDKSVWIWEEVGEDDFETIAVLQEHTADVKTVAWHPEEELLASGSYDDDVRLWKEDVDDWGCVGILSGHKSTVWMVEWEAVAVSAWLSAQDSEEKAAWVTRREKSGPRLASCSDDISIKIWRRKPKENLGTQNSLSIIRNNNSMEEWLEEATLPIVHERAIYAISWSKKTGRMVSSGGDGKIVVYEERWKSPHESNSINMNVNSETPDAIETAVGSASKTEETEWVVVAEMNDSHGVFEVNHVAWAPRADKDKKEGVDEEVIISTGDDGIVKVWILNI